MTWRNLKRVARSAKSRRRADIRDERRMIEIALEMRKFQRMSQYPPSKYASDFARLSAGTVSSQARVAVAGSVPGAMDGVGAGVASATLGEGVWANAAIPRTKMRQIAATEDFMVARVKEIAESVNV